MRASVWLAATAVAFLSLGAVMMKADTMETFELDIRAGEPLADAMARSSLRIDVPITLGMHGIPLPPLADWSAERYRLRLAENVTIPWTPSGGTVWMHTGVINQIDLDFANLSLGRTDGDWHTPWTAPQSEPLDAAAKSIAELYTLLLGLDPVGNAGPSCKGDIPRPENPFCSEPETLPEGLSTQDVLDSITEFALKYQSDLRRDPQLLEVAPAPLVLGQWWLADGSKVDLFVSTILSAADTSIPYQDRDVTVAASLTVTDFFRTGVSKLIETCYDQQAIFPEAVRYTQQQAAQIFHGLYSDFFPPLVDGKPVSDMRVLRGLDWSGLQDRYWNDPSFRDGFCSLLRELEDEAGYTGPKPPLR